jgi:aspartate/methionine/tyrosine aminotransferase
VEFTPFRYMSWAKGRRARVRFPLAMSGLPAPGPELLPLTAELLTLEEVDAYGPASLRAAVADAYGVRPGQVLLAGGTSEANFVLAGVLLAPGDEVLVEDPGYEVLATLGSWFGARTAPLPRTCADGFRLPLDAVAARLGPRTRLVIVTSPHNPSGATLRTEDLRGLGELMERHGAHAIVDEVYRDFQTAPGPIAQAVHPRLLTTSSLTKVYGLGSIRAGWALAPEDIVEKGQQMLDFMSVAPPSVPCRIAQSAFRARAALLGRAHGVVVAGRPVAAAFLRDARRLAAALPDAGIVFFARTVPAVDTLAFAEWLVREEETQVVPGDFFGAPGFVRVGFGAGAETVREGLERLERGLARFGGRA